jgi:alkaline phosphatase D
MERRNFLTGLAAGTVGWIAGGRIAGSTNVAQVYAAPVPFIASAEAATPASLFTVDTTATAESVRGTYPQSVAAGDPNPHGAVIWTRVAPQALKNGATVAWQVADASDFGAMAASCSPAPRRR